MIRVGVISHLRRFRIQFNTSILQTSSTPPPTSSLEENGIFFHGQSDDGATASTSSFAPKLFNTEIKALQNVQQVESGVGFTIVLADGELYGCGLNTSGQLGYQGYSKYQADKMESVVENLPVVTTMSRIRASVSSPIISLSAGRQHIGFINDVGKVYLMGSNRSGQCARRICFDEDHFESPREFNFDTSIRFGSPAKKIACGFDHTAVLLEDGSILTFGNGWDGQLGRDAFNSDHSPSLIHQTDVKFIDLMACADWNLALTEDGRIFGWGNNEYNQISSEDVDRIGIPKEILFDEFFENIEVKKIACSSSQGFALVKSTVKAGLSLYSWGYGYHNEGLEPTTRKYPREIFIDRDIKDISAGVNAVAVITEDDRILTFGKNENDTLGHLQKGNTAEYIIETPKVVQQVSIGMNHVVIVGSKETKRVESDFSRQVVEENFTESDFSNQVVEEVFTELEQMMEKAEVDEIEPKEVDEIEPDKVEERKTSTYKGRNFDPNFTQKSAEPKVIKTYPKTKSTYQGKNFDPKYRPGSQKIPVHDKPIPKNYKGKNFDPNFQPQSNHTSTPIRSAYKGKNFNPRFRFQNVEKKSSYQGKNFDPNYQERFRKSEKP